MQHKGRRASKLWGQNSNFYMVERRKGVSQGDLEGEIQEVDGKLGNSGVLDQQSLDSENRNQCFSFFNMHMNHHLLKCRFSFSKSEVGSEIIHL